MKEDERTYGLRWFTPVGEIDLCGHATFGTAFVLFRFEEQTADTLHFHAKKCGHHLIVAKNGDMLAMRFPTIAPERYAYAEYMGEGMGAVPSEVYRTERDLLLVYDSEETIRNMKPDFAKLKEFPVGLSVYVTAKSSGNDYDIVARAFWPKINVNEDPVCGTMYCTLMPFWRERQKMRLVARQLSARGGTVYCSYNGDVGISGRGALYSVGTIFVNDLTSIPYRKSIRRIQPNSAKLWRTSARWAFPAFQRRTPNSTDSMPKKGCFFAEFSIRRLSKNFNSRRQSFPLPSSKTC